MSAPSGSGSKIYKPYISPTLGELYDELGWMMIYAPTFIDPGGYFPEQNIETAFAGLNGGLDTLRGKLGEERHAKIRAMPDEMRHCSRRTRRRKRDRPSGGAKSPRKWRHCFFKNGREPSNAPWMRGWLCDRNGRNRRSPSRAVGRAGASRRRSVTFPMLSVFGHRRLETLYASGQR
jgi:hypothetical protein